MLSIAFTPTNNIGTEFNVSREGPSSKNVLTSCNRLDQQPNIRMRSHGLRQLVGDKSVASCQ